VRVRHHLLTLLAISTALPVLASESLAAQVADPDPSRFAETFQGFAQWDAENFVPRDGILFIGSSSINFWRTAESFPDLPVINRGFGGSHASDATHWVRDGVLKYDPAIVVYYEGDNDITQGKKSPQVMEDFRDFVRAIRNAGSDAEIVFLSIKPSPARMDVWSEMQKANDELRAFTESEGGLHYIDVGSDLLGRNGRPRPELYVADGIHMTPAGYEIWDRIVGPVLRSLH